MKTQISFLVVGLLLVLAVASFGYSAHTSARVRELELRLQSAETALRSHSQSLAETTALERLRNLETRLQQTETTVTQIQPVIANDTTGLEQRIHHIEQQIKPHLETLPPYNPNR